MLKGVFNVKVPIYMCVECLVCLIFRKGGHLKKKRTVYTGLWWFLFQHTKTDTTISIWRKSLQNTIDFIGHGVLFHLPYYSLFQRLQLGRNHISFQIISSNCDVVRRPRTCEQNNLTKSANATNKSRVLLMYRQKWSFNALVT